MTESSPSRGRAARFAQDAREQGWDASETGRDLFQQSTERPTLAVESVIARRGTEVITATWVDGWALGPIGWHAAPHKTHPVKNAATARRCMAAEPGDC